MLDPKSIRTVTDLREDPVSVLRAAKDAAEPIYVFYRSSLQAAIVNIQDFNDLLEELEDLKDALEVLQRQKDPARELVPWEEVKRKLNL